MRIDCKLLPNKKKKKKNGSSKSFFLEALQPRPSYGVEFVPSITI